MFLHLQIALPAEPTAPSIARHRIGALKSLVPDDVVHNVQVVVSELVTNAVVHAGLGLDDHVELDLQTRPGSVEVMLHYPEHRGFELTLPLEPREASGFGLFLVDQMASRWSVIETRGEMEALFEVDLPSGRREAAHVHPQRPEGGTRGIGFLQGGRRNDQGRGGENDASTLAFCAGRRRGRLARGNGRDRRDHVPAAPSAISNAALGDAR